MNTDLKERISTLLSDLIEDLDNKDIIIDNAYNRLASKKKVNEENIIDAILAAFKDEVEDDIYFEEEDDNNGDIYGLLRTSSYDDNTIQSAVDGFEKEFYSEYDIDRGAEGSYYDEKAKVYRPKSEKNKDKGFGEFEIKDGEHDKFKQNELATKTDKVHRTKSDMLVRY